MSEPQATQRAVSLAHSTVSGIVARREQKGFIERRVLAEDRRVSLFVPSRAVREFIAGRAAAILSGDELLYAGAILKLHSAHLLLTIDLAGTALFAAEGASTAAQANLDLLGILVLSFATALGGGIIRDLLIGDSPPSSIRDWRYAATALSVGFAVFLLHTTTAHMNPWVLTTLDAAGLSLFAVSGAAKALEFKIHPLLATMMGGITGVGGGTIRDILIDQVPVVLRADVYATAALLGAAVTVLLLRVGARAPLASVAGIVVCFAVRMLAVYYHWNLPKA